MSWQPEGRKRPTGTHLSPDMVPPNLPADFAFDLSAPVVTAPDGVTFSVPTTLSVDSSAAAIISPDNLKPKDWVVISRATKLLYAYDLNGGEPTTAKTAVFAWKVQYDGLRPGRNHEWGGQERADLFRSNGELCR